VNEPDDLEALIGQIQECFQEQDHLLFDEAYEHLLGGPCLSSRLDSVEERLGRPLPASYRTFLQRHDGWTRFTGDAVVLGSHDHGAVWVRQRIAALSELFYESGPDPFDRGCFPVVLGEDARTFLVADPGTLRSDGEMDLISYDLTRESKRFPDFIEFLRHKLKVLHRIIESERNGTTDD
jgi:hypothetical protein